jgi:integrase
MDEIKKKIKEERSNIKENSLNAYLSNIKRIFKDVFDNEIDIKKFNQFVKVKKYLDELNPATRKNIMTSIIVLLKAYNINKKTLKKYEKYFEEIVVDFENNYDNQEKSEKEKKNWITKDELDKKINDLEENIDEIDFENLTKTNEDIIQQHLILKLYSEIPPIRNDYAQMKVYHNKNIKGENYIDLTNKKIILNNYKTDKTYGEKQIELNNNIIQLIKRWINITGNEYLLINIRDKNPMTSNGLTKYINKIFKPKKVSTTILRKLYLSEKYPVIHNRKDMKKDAYIMGHSISTQQSIYRKK